MSEHTTVKVRGGELSHQGWMFFIRKNCACEWGSRVYSAAGTADGKGEDLGNTEGGRKTSKAMRLWGGAIM